MKLQIGQCYDEYKNYFPNNLTFLVFISYNKNRVFKQDNIIDAF